MKVALGTVIYQAAWSYKEEFIQAVNNQTTQNFEVLFINDGIGEKEVEELKSAIQRKVTITEVEKNRSISEIRKILLEEAKRIGIDLLVLSDFDDVFDRNRVEKAVHAVENDICIYYNNLKTFDGNVVFQYLPIQVNHYKDILEYNFLGLSNTTLKMDLIDMDFIRKLKDVKTNVFDWYLFSKLLAEGKRGKLIEDSYTYYRIGENNIAGLATQNLDAYKKELIIKREHYRLLCDSGDLFEDLYGIYSGFSVEQLTKKDNSYLNQCLNGYWWELIKIY